MLFQNTGSGDESRTSHHTTDMNMKHKDATLFSTLTATMSCAAESRLSQKQLEPTDKCASFHDARNNETACRDMMVPQPTRDTKGKLQTERMQISHEFPNASNHSTHCWAHAQNPRRQNSLVDKTANSFTFNLYMGALDTWISPRGPQRSLPQTTSEQFEDRIEMSLTTVVNRETVDMGLHPVSN